MNIFTKKGTIQKTIIAILMVLCINFIVPTYSHAGIGGVLINPILDLGASLGDIVESLLQWSMTGQFAAGEKLSQSKILVDQGDNRIKNGSGNATISVSADELDLGWFTNSNNYQVPIIEYTPEEIFSNKIPYLDINFINPTWTKQNSQYKIDGIAAELQETIAGWYIALRNLAIVGLLCVLVYVGIRILLSSTAGDKAKFKTMFTDWLIALCILFFLHYIMSFTLTMVNSVNNALTGGQTYQSNGVVIEVDGAKYATNFMGAARFMVQSKDTVERFGYMLIYWALVAYTVIFTWHYLKRVLMMAFLTIIAPLVALTYPIDKIGDGKAQAFSMWLKEYVYNALIQPFHLIIYMIFVGSAIDFAKTNMIYAIVAVGFILPAEKLLKKMFGFDKGPLGTMGALAGFTAGSLASKFGSGKGSGGGEKGGNNQEENKPPRYQPRHGTDGIDYAEDHNLDRGGPQEPTSSEPRSTTEQQTQNELPDSRGLPFDDAIDVPYREVPLDGNTEGGQQNTSQNENGPFERLSDDDVEEMAPERPRTMDDLEQNSREQSSGASGQTQRGERSAENTRQPGRFRQGMRNIANAHGGTKGILKNTAKTLGRAAKFTARTAFTAAGMAAGAGAGLASGKGFGGVIAGATAGRQLGSRLGTTLSNMPENAYNVANSVANKVGGAVSREIDTFNGNTRLHDKAQARKFMKDSSTEQYVRDKLTADNNGRAPSDKQVKEEMNNIKMYANEGMTDIAQIYRARKAEKFGVDADQAAKIALLAQDRGIDSKVLGDQKQYDQRQQDFTQEFMDKGLSEAQASAKADYVLNVMKAQVGQRHNLKNVGGRARVVQPTQNTNPDGGTTRGTRTQNVNPDGGTTRRTRTQNVNPNGGTTRRTRTQNTNPDGGTTRRTRTQNTNPNGGTTRRRGRPRTQNNNSDPSGSNN